MKQLKVSNLKKDEKLTYYIKEKYPNVLKSTIYKSIRNKDIKVNDKRIGDENYLVSNGDIITIYIDDYLLYGFPKNIDIIYEDENIVIVYKPQGVLSNNEGKEIGEKTFEKYVKSILGENIKICHRLDRNTSGLLVFSKNNNAYNEMLLGFKNGYISKEYIAYVDGINFKSNYIHYDNYILKDNKTGMSKIYDKNVANSKNIITDVYVVKSFKDKNYSIVKVNIHTGKTHQIRALMSYISHPIIGDSKYGKNSVNKKFKKYKQLLFAVKYTFNFPSDSYLYYLNSKIIELDKKYYDKKI